MNLLLIIFCSLMGCSNSSDNSSIDKVVVMKVDFELETFVAVSCDNFESVFEKEMKIIEITEQEKLNQLNLLVKDLKIDKDNYIPDVRAKAIIYFSDGQKDTLCISSLGVLFNRKSMLQSTQIVKFIGEAH